MSQHTLHRDVAILGTGSALPERRVTNAELEPLVGNYDKSSGDFAIWVDRVTHIQERRFVEPEPEATRRLSYQSAQRAIEAAGVDPGEIDQIIFCSFTFDDMYPGEHAWLASELGTKGGSFFLTAACSGSLWGLTLARSLVQSGQCRNVLVIGVEAISKVLDWEDPITAILFADAAGAVVIGRKDDREDTGFLGKSIHYSSYARGNIEMRNSNVPLEYTTPGETPRLQARAFLGMKGGPRVLRNAINSMAGAVVECLGFTMEDLKRDDPSLREVLQRVKVIPHQANGRILDGLQDKLGLHRDNLYRTVYFAGNSSAATNMLTLDYAVREGNLMREDPPEGERRMGTISPCGRTLEKGDLVVVTSIGAGYLWGALAFVHAY